MPEPPLVYISILNWNGYQDTIECVQSVEAMDYPNKRIIVVDNGSKDNSVKMIRRNCRGIELLQSHENLGFASGHELAMRHAKKEGAQLIWLLNNDATVKPDSLDELVKAYRQYGNHLYGAIVLDTKDPDVVDDNILWRIEEFDNPYAKHHFTINTGSYSAYFQDHPEPMKVGSLHGAGMMIPLSVIKLHGFIDTSFFLYGEETDYCFRMREEGVQSFIVPSAIIYHKAKSSTSGHAKVKRVVDYYIKRNFILFAKRHYRPEFYQRLARNERRHSWKSMLLGWIPGISKKGLYHRLERKGVWHGLKGKTGKVLAPEDFL